MDSIELVRRVIRKQAAMQKEAGKGRSLAEGLAEFGFGQKRAPIPTGKGSYGGASSSIPMPAKTTTTVTDPGRMKLIKDRISNFSWKKDWADTRKGRLAAGTVGTLGAGAGYGASKLLEGDDEGVKVPAPTGAELAKARRAAGKPKAEAIQSALSPEVLAGAGGAAAGGAAGYALAPTLGISRGAGALGGGALTAVAAAILANKLKEKGGKKAFDATPPSMT